MARFLLRINSHGGTTASFKNQYPSVQRRYLQAAHRVLRVADATASFWKCERDKAVTHAMTYGPKLGDAQLRIKRLETLVQTLLDNDPGDITADGVTVLEAWRNEARQNLGRYP